MSSWKGDLAETYKRIFGAEMPPEKDECKKCGGKMKPSLAIVAGIISGDDFGDGDTEGATLSFGSGNVGNSMKCEVCGHSYHLQTRKK